MGSKKSNSRTKQFINQSPIEALRDVGTGVRDSFVSDLGAGSMSSLWEQFLGTSEKKQPSQGDLKEGEELNFKDFSKKQESQLQNIEAGISYAREIIHGEKKIGQENQQEIEVKIQEIIIELKQLVASSQELKIVAKEITKEQRITKPGKYHLSFFKWMLQVVHSARLRIEDAGTWMSMFKSKKANKQYWSMFKKHGTTFGMSNERVVATQTG